MELTIIAEGLNQTFANFDYSILNLLHNFAENTNGMFTPLILFISLIAEKGIGLFIIAISLMCLKNTRKLGVCMFIAIVFGAIITNFVLKDFIARPRPFNTTNEYYNWWKFVGETVATGYSFPSGHVTATMAAMTSVFLLCNKKYSWISFLFVFIMGMSRNYLMVHFPSDVLGGIIAGGMGGIIAFLITKAIYNVEYIKRRNKNEEKNI